MTLHDLAPTVHPDPATLGRVTAAHASAVIRSALQERGRARVMLAAAPSQQPLLEALSRLDVDFSAVEFFHMDDYLGLPADAPQGFGNWLQEHFISKLPASGVFHRIDPGLAPDEAARAYAAAMGDEPFDLTLCGLGVNAHLAFNDPPARFDDERTARPVELEITSRQQQVDEGHFASLDDVPERAITVTIPRLLNTGHVICSVLGTAKRAAVRETLARPLDPAVPGTALKLHPHVELHIDREASDD
ncbi:6-phosphogluconolactonase [Mariniluteicoccus flavus]